MNKKHAKEKIVEDPNKIAGYAALIGEVAAAVLEKMLFHFQELITVFSRIIRPAA